ncbi:MAG: hypothetical protein A2284_02550 [Deltaproteobacteria bacterium RIFOXYA12_FULL_61_11]|nr:MAG: hypothetical protein A2284_02550 [Deltaproteobacteria bacterium RIFOXYA12_FULL_61_11]
MHDESSFDDENESGQDHEEPMLFLGQRDLHDAHRIQADLAERGVTVDLVHEGEHCSRGCKITVEVWFAESGLPIVRDYLGEEWQRDAGDLAYDPTLAAAVFDPDKPETICPACGTTFATTLSECPECGLGFGDP